MDCLASMYIDNELNLKEKIQFVDRIQAYPPFYEDTRALLLQETLLQAPPDTSMLPAQPPTAVMAGYLLKKMFKPLIYATAGLVTVGLLLFNLYSPPSALQCLNRFVIYEPAARQVELTGTFTGWQRTQMAPIGNTGYWELRLRVPSGEHRFAYILDGSNPMPDPTLPVREKDDFGGENSILIVEERT